MPGIVRIGDRVNGICTCHEDPISVSGQIVKGASTVNAEGSSVARIGDIVKADCGHTGRIVKGSAKNNAEGVGIARLGDRVEGCFSGSIVKASSKVNTV